MLPSYIGSGTLVCILKYLIYASNYKFVKVKNTLSEWEIKSNKMTQLRFEALDGVSGVGVSCHKTA